MQRLLGFLITHNGWLFSATLSQSDCCSYLLRGNQISCSPSFLSSLWVIPSSGRLLSCLSLRLHLPQRPKWPQVSFLPFFPRLCLPVFVAVTFLFLVKRKSLSCLSRFGQNLETPHAVGPFTAEISILTLLTKQCNLIPGGIFFHSECQYNGNHLVFNEWPVT